MTLCDENINELRYQLLCMEQPFVLAEHKLRASHTLTQGGQLSLGILIERLAEPGDPIFLNEMLVTTGPLNPGPPRKMRVTLKYQIEHILYEILYPEQSPRAELLGDSQLNTDISTGPSKPLPKQSLMEMKADWDKARDLAIGELSPAELGGAYAFVSDWQSFWATHGNKDLDALRKWSRVQVEAIWSGHFGAQTPGTQSVTNAPVPEDSAPHLGLEDEEKLRIAYSRAWSLYEGARNTAARKPIAFRGLEDIQKRHPRLKLHLDYLRKLLA
ncbi:MAG: hypothetical protein HOK97_05255 [Deltaproteobacteria bacterium]|jgi:hypothetical protein|nr:hypothetical protein [Deltaproteobacteria bacterium]MBT6489148.1 hypothetical protein [Deltaproteobacteria bacterium]